MRIPRKKIIASSIIDFQSAETNLNDLIRSLDMDPVSGTGKLKDKQFGRDVRKALESAEASKRLLQKYMR